MANKTLTPQQERFCQFYIKNKSTYGNVTRSYAAAHDIDLDSMSRVAKFDISGNMIEESEYERACSVCAVSGHRLLRMDKINARRIVLLNELLKDDIVDAELASLVQQDEDKNSKLGAIREFNKLKSRIIDVPTVIIPIPIYSGKSVEKKNVGNSIQGHNGDKKGVRPKKKD